MPRQNPPCGNNDCGISSGIDGSITYGTGKLDDNGYWEHNCDVCTKANHDRDQELLAELAKKEEERKKAADFLFTMMETKGAACSTVKDGHVILFKTSYLKDLLEKYSDQKTITIFLQRPDFKKTGN